MFMKRSPPLFLFLTTKGWHKANIRSERSNRNNPIFLCNFAFIYGHNTKNWWVFVRNNVPHERAIRNQKQKFEDTGSVHNQRPLICFHPGWSTGNIAAVSKSVPVHHHAQQLHLSMAPVHHVTTKDLALHTYKVQLRQELKPTDPRTALCVHRLDFGKHGQICKFLQKKFIIMRDRMI